MAYERIHPDSIIDIIEDGNADEDGCQQDLDDSDDICKVFGVKISSLGEDARRIYENLMRDHNRKPPEVQKPTQIYERSEREQEIGAMICEFSERIDNEIGKGKLPFSKAYLKPAIWMVERRMSSDWGRSNFLSASEGFGIFLTESDTNLTYNQLGHVSIYLKNIHAGTVLAAYSGWKFSPWELKKIVTDVVDFHDDLPETY